MRPQSGRILFLGLWPLRGHLFIRKKRGVLVSGFGRAASEGLERAFFWAGLRFL